MRRIATWLVVIAAGIFIGRWTAFVEKKNTIENKECEKNQNLLASERKLESERHTMINRIVRSFLTRPSEMTAPNSEFSEAEAKKYRIEQSKDLIRLLNNRLNVAEISVPDHNIESIVNQMNDFMAGWAEQFVRIGPDLVEEMSQEIENALCNNESKDSQQLMFSRLGILVPELMRSSSYDCLIENREKEDIVTWTALDAWRSSGQPKTEAIKELENRAQDPRTLRRFVPVEQEEAVRGLLASEKMTRPITTPLNSDVP